MNIHSKMDINKYPQYKERTIVAILSGQNWKFLPIYEKRKKQWNFPCNYTQEDKIKWLERVQEICQKQ